MKIDAGKIKSWVERVERLLEERAAINGDIKDIYAEVKSHDHDAKAVRKLIQRRAADPADLAEQDALLAAYTDAMAGKIKAATAIAGGATIRDAAKAGGISVGAAAALAKHVQESSFVNTQPHDHETGEIKEAATPSDDAGHRGEQSSPAEQSVNPDPPLERVPLEHRNGQGEQSGTFDYDSLEAMKARLDEAKRAKGFAA